MLTVDDKERLYLNKEALPNLNLPANFLGAVLLCRVMHFFTPENVTQMFKNVQSWLVPGGRFYLVVMSPYHYSLKGFAKTYEHRLANGDKWPGIITTMTKDYIPKYKGKIPDFLHVMDASVLSKIAADNGFLIKHLELFGHNRTSKENGRGYIGAVLVKKDGEENECN